MKRVFADTALNVSQGDFEKPTGVDMELNCDESEQTSVNESFD